MKFDFTNGDDQLSEQSGTGHYGTSNHVHHPCLSLS